MLEREHAVLKSEIQALREHSAPATPPGSPAPRLSPTPSRLDGLPQQRLRRLQRRASFVESDTMEQQLVGLSAEEKADVLARSVQALHRRMDLQNEAWRTKLRAAERQAIQATGELRVKRLEAEDSAAAVRVRERERVPHLRFPPGKYSLTPPASAPVQRLKSQLQEAWAEHGRAEQRAKRAEQGIVARGIAGGSGGSAAGEPGSGGAQGGPGGSGADRARVEQALTDMLRRSGSAALRLAVSRLHLHFAGLDAQLRALIDAVSSSNDVDGGGDRGNGEDGGNGAGKQGGGTRGSRDVLSSLPPLPALPPQLLHEGLLQQYAQPERAWQALVEAGGGAGHAKSTDASAPSEGRPALTEAPREHEHGGSAVAGGGPSVGQVVDASEGGVMLEAALHATSHAAPSAAGSENANSSAPLAENAGALTLALLSRYAAHAGALVRALIVQEQELARARGAWRAMTAETGGDAGAMCVRLQGQLAAARSREKDLEQQLEAARLSEVRACGVGRGAARTRPAALSNLGQLTHGVPGWHFSPHRLLPRRPSQAVAAASRGRPAVEASASAEAEAVPPWLEGASGALESAESLLQADSAVRRRRAQASRALFEATQQARRARHTLETDPPEKAEELDRLKVRPTPCSSYPPTLHTR